MSNSLATLHDSLPLDIQSSILGSVLEQVYVFVIDNSKADDLKTFLQTSGFKNILSKIENELTTVTAQKESVFPKKVVFNENVSADSIDSIKNSIESRCCNTESVASCANLSTETACNTSYETGSLTNINCFWNYNNKCQPANGCVNCSNTLNEDKTNVSTAISGLLNSEQQTTLANQKSQFNSNTLFEDKAAIQPKVSAAIQPKVAAIQPNVPAATQSKVSATQSKISDAISNNQSTISSLGNDTPSQLESNNQSTISSLGKDTPSEVATQAKQYVQDQQLIVPL